MDIQTFFEAYTNAKFNHPIQGLNKPKSTSWVTKNLRRNFEQALVTAKRPYLKGFLVKLFLRKKFLFCRALQKARSFLGNFFQL